MMKEITKAWIEILIKPVSSFPVLFFLGSFGGFAGHEKDSLLGIWKNESLEDTVRISAMTDRIWDYYLFSDPDSAIYFAGKIVDFARQKKLRVQEGMGINLIGNGYFVQADYAKAIDYYQQCLAILQETGNYEMAASPYNNMGACYRQMGDLHNALVSFEKSLRLSEQKKDWPGYAGSNSNIGTIYHLQEDYPSALKYYLESERIRDSIGDERGLSESLANIGIVYLAMGFKDSALRYQSRSLEIDRKMNNYHGMISGYLNMASIYQKESEVDSTAHYLMLAKEYAEKIGDKKGQISVYNKLSELSYSEGKLQLARGQAENALRLSQEIGFIEGIRIASGHLHQIYKSLGSYKKSLEMYELHVTMRDSLKNEEHSQDLMRQKFQYDYEKKTAADSLLQVEEMKQNNLKLEAAEAKSAKNELELSSQKKQKIYLFVLLGLAALFAVFMFNRFKVTERQRKLILEQKKESDAQKEQIIVQHEKLEASHKEISDSIVYAKRLQQAILPKLEEIEFHFPDNFVLFRPKDVVSGDFYWFEKTDHASYLAVADCTGHGVPGAMVSVVCSNALNRSLIEFQCKHPNEILDKSRDLIVETFAKSGQNVKDGMDISLCCIQGNQLTYSGANNPLWILRNQEIIELVADKQPVGALDNGKPFSKQVFELKTHDMIYLFSDGYADQFGGEKGKKFKTKSLRELLISIHTLPTHDQKFRLSEAFETWRGKLEQVDDVCVIGVRV